MEQPPRRTSRRLAGQEPEPPLPSPRQRTRPQDGPPAGPRPAPAAELFRAAIGQAVNPITPQQSSRRPITNTPGSVPPPPQRVTRFRDIFNVHDGPARLEDSDLPRGDTRPPSPALPQRRDAPIQPVSLPRQSPAVEGRPGAAPPLGPHGPASLQPPRPSPQPFARPPPTPQPQQAPQAPHVPQGRGMEPEQAVDMVMVRENLALRREIELYILRLQEEGNRHAETARALEETRKAQAETEMRLSRMEAAAKAERDRHTVHVAASAAAARREAIAEMTNKQQQQAEAPQAHARAQEDHSRREAPVEAPPHDFVAEDPPHPQSPVEVESEDTERIPPSPGAISFGTTANAGAGGPIYMPIHLDMKKPHILNSIDPPDVGQWLINDREYRISATARNFVVPRTRDCLAPHIRDGMAVIADTFGVTLTDEMAIRRSDAPLPPLHEGDPEEFYEWDRQARHVLHLIAETRGEPGTVQLKSYDALLKKSLRMNVSLGVWKTIVADFRLQYNTLVKKHHLQRTFDSTAGRKYIIKQLSDIVYPPAMRTRMQGITEHRNIKDPDLWFRELATLEKEWIGVQAANTKVTTDTSSNANHAKPSKQQDSRHKGPSARAAVGGDVPASTVKASNRDVKSSGPKSSVVKPAKTKPAPDNKTVGIDSASAKLSSSSSPSDPNGCLYCNGNHWIRDCPKCPKEKISELKKAHAEKLRTRKSAFASARRATAETRTTVHVSTVDGTLCSGGLTVPFTLDTGATHSFISQTRAIQALPRGRRITALKRPFDVNTAAAGPPLRATHYVELAVTLRMSDGVKRVPRLRLYVVPGLDDSIVLLGRSCIKHQFGIDLNKAVQHATVTSMPTHAVVHSAVASPTSPPSTSPSSPAAPATSTVSDDGVQLPDMSIPVSVPGPSAHDVSDEEQLDDRQPQLATHDPAATLAYLTIKLEKMRSELPNPNDPAVEQFIRKIVTQFADVFRLQLCANEKPVTIPGMPDGLMINVDDEKFKRLRMRPRVYSKPISDMLAQYMAKLEAGGYIEFDPTVTYASPVLAVRKATAPPLGAENIASSSPERTGDGTASAKASHTPNARSQRPNDGAIILKPMSLMEFFRVAVDLRGVNGCMDKIITPLPRISVLRTYLNGMKFFGKMDLNNGFWQLLLDPRCRKYFAICTDRGTWVPTRALQGSKNSAGPFHQAIARILGPLLYNVCLLYVDDILVFGRTLPEFLDNWCKVLAALKGAGVTASVKKTEFYSREVEYCGRVISADGIGFNPKFVDTLYNTPKPTDAAQLRTFLGSVGWMQEGLPEFSASIEVLQQLSTAAIRMIPDGKPSTNTHAQRVSLADAGWNEQHDAAWDNLLNAIAHSVKLSHPEQGDEWDTCVFTDASDTCWSGVVTQRLKTEAHLPISEQRHRPLAFTSGRFDATQLRWNICDKEAYAILQTCIKCQHILECVPKFIIHTDHRNLAFILMPDSARAIGAGRIAADRLQRWNVIMASFSYEIVHIDGEDNFIADMFSRWAAPPLTPAVDGSPSASGAPSDSPARTPVATARVVTASDTGAYLGTRARTRRIDLQTVSAPPPLPSARIPPDGAHVIDSDTDDDVVPHAAPTATVATDGDSDGDVMPGLIPAPRSFPSQSAPIQQPHAPLSSSTDDADADSLPDVNAINQWMEHAAPSVDDILDAQRRMHASETRHIRNVRKHNGVWVGPDDRLYVPDAESLRLRLCITAHQGMGMHRGIDTTLAFLRSYVFWPHMEQFVANHCRKCLSCLKTKGGEVIHRFNLQTQQVTAPGQLLSFDFATVRLDPRTRRGDGVLQHVLVVVDNFARFVQLYPATTMTSDVIVDALLDWFSKYGVCTSWTSDRGTHFFNDIMTALAQRLRATHHFTAAYAPWSNGVVERVNRDIREILSAMMLDARAADEDWPQFLPAVCHAINSSPSSRLNGYSPYQAFLGRQSVTPLDVVFIRDPPRLAPLNSLRTQRAIEEFARTLDNIHADITSHPRRPAPAASNAVAVDFGIGDYVLIARRVTDKTRSKDKTRPIWHGPALVTRKVNERVFLVKDLITDREQEVHANFLKLYADRSLRWNRYVRHSAAHGSRGFVPLRIIEWKMIGTDPHVHVEWEDEAPTWEPWRRFRTDAPRLARAFLNAQPPQVRQKLLQHST